MQTPHPRPAARHGTKPGRHPAPDAARALATRLLTSVAEGRMLDDTPADGAPEVRARALRLATATLRHLPRADAVLDPHLRRAPPDAVRAALRLAVVEHHVLGAPAHAVVDGAVTLMQAGRDTRPFGGLANAVLRKAVAFQGWDALPVPNLPAWLRAPLLAAHGPATVAAIEAAHLAGPALDLTLAPGTDPAALVALDAQPLPGGSFRLAQGAQVSALPGFDTGAFWVQDAAAAQPARALMAHVAKGAPVLDLCAAPGGKALQLAACGADVTAVDVSEPRLARLRANLARTRLSAQVVAADILSWSPPAPVPALLLDAPCTATGTIRRHPDLPHVRRPSDLSALTALQAALIDRAVGFLAPGGVMAVCTCSLLPAEGEEMVTAALSRHPRLRPLPLDLPLGRASGPGWRTRPDELSELGGLDGFYLALLALD
jgi:16S rRNA (cytosine967-C5)-methyltransferase